MSSEDRWHYKGARCARCGRELNADGNSPAETYMATFNGLCYPCTSAPPWRTHVSSLDGAERWSHRPPDPSWRRWRENRIYYPDCTCDHGSVRVNGAPRQCDRCFDRFNSHPARRRYWALKEKITTAAINRYARLVGACLRIRPDPESNRFWERAKALPESDKETLRRQVVAQHDRAMARLEARYGPSTSWERPQI